MTDNIIFSPTNLDLLLIDYCQKNGRPASGKALINILHNNCNRLQSFFSFYSAQTEQTLSEEQVFSKFIDIILQKHPKNFPEWFHSNQFIDIVITLKGTCYCTIKQESIHSVTIAEHSFCIIPSHMMHSIEADEDAILLHFLIREDLLHFHVSDMISANDDVLSYFFRILFQDQNPCILISPFFFRNELIILLEHMCHEYSLHPKYNQNILYYSLGIMFTLMERCRSGPLQYIGLSDQKPLRFPLIYSYICDNYATTSSKDVANHFHISQSYLCKIFQDATSQSVTTAIQQIRMQNARNLLSRTDLPIQVIAEQVGYSDVTFFIRLFKKYYKITPLQYRLANK